MQDLRGQYECGEIEDYKISLKKIESDIIEKYGQKGELYFKRLKELLLDKEAHNLLENEGNYSAKDARFSLKCTVKMFLRDYIFALIAGITFTAYLYYKINQCCRHRRINKMTK